MPSVNDALFNAIVRHQIHLQRLSTQTVQELVQLLNDSELDIIAKLSKKELTAFSLRRLNAILDEIRAINRDAYDRLSDEVSGRLGAIAEYEAGFTARLIEKVLPFKISMTQPTLEQLQAILTSKPMQGRFIREELEDLSDARIKQLEQALRIGLVEGETTPEIMRRIRGTRELKYKDGLLERSRGDVERLVRTSITHVTARARDLLYTNNESVVKAWRFAATLDRRTTVICASLDGQVFGLGTGPMPPRHPNCRSTSTPVLKSWEEINLDLNELPASTRASMNGQVPEDVTYQEWLRKQPRDVVEDVLGKTKARLFLEGDLSLDRFVDFTGETYTLKELKKLESSVFASLQIK